jgi:VWFA-related protein
VNKTLTLISVLVGCLVVVFLACHKKEEPKPAEGDTPYSNPHDSLTESMKSNAFQFDTGSAGSRWVKGYLSVTDQDGRPLENFNRANFQVSESAASSVYAIPTGDVTVSTVGGSGQAIATPLIMDYSGSMSGQPIVDMDSAVKTFVRLMQPQDKGEIIKFSSTYEVVQPFTTDKALLIASIDSFWPGTGGSTALCDAIYQGLIDVVPQTGARAVVTFTDGGENNSSHTWSEVISRACSTGLAVYSVGLGGYVDSLILKHVADTTGGRYFYAPTSQGLEEIYQLISGQLRKAYTLQWNVKSSSGASVQTTLKATYTAQKGTFTSTSKGSFVAP